MQYQWCNNCYGFYYDVVSYDCSQCGYIVVIGEVEGYIDSEDQWYIGEN